MPDMKPMLFNTEMVRAIQDDRKTVTRRVLKPQPEGVHKALGYSKENDGTFEFLCGGFDGEKFSDWLTAVKMPYQPGDILYVRETWYYEDHLHITTEGNPDLPSGRYSYRYIYRASEPDYPVNIGVGEHGWKPSIHMPKEAARIFLRVTDVRVERLQDITEEQALKEGCNDYTSTALGFAYIWESTIKRSDLDRYGWNANPWVWVIEFEKISKEEALI